MIGITKRAHSGQSDGAMAVGLLVVAVLFFVSIWIIVGVDQVQASETCVVTKGGKPVDEWGPGYHFRNFLTTKKKGCFRFQRTTLNATTDDSSSADYTIRAPDGKTRDAVVIAAIPYQVGFHIPGVMPTINPDGSPSAVTAREKNIAFVFQYVGTTEDRVVERVIKNFTSKTVQTVVQGYNADDIYSGTATMDITAQIKSILAQEYAAKGIVIDDFQIAPPVFDPEYEAARRGVQLAKQGAAKAQQEAAATATAAAGPAAATVQAAAAQATVASIDAQASITKANAEATAIAVKVAAYGGPENYIASLNAQAVANAGAIYLPSNTIPLFAVPTPAP